MRKSLLFSTLLALPFITTPLHAGSGAGMAPDEVHQLKQILGAQEGVSVLDAAKQIRAELGSGPSVMSNINDLKKTLGSTNMGDNLEDIAKGLLMHMKAHVASHTMTDDHMMPHKQKNVAEAENLSAALEAYFVN